MSSYIDPHKSGNKMKEKKKKTERLRGGQVRSFEHNA